MLLYTVLRVTEIIMLLLLLKVSAIVNPYGPSITNDITKCIAGLIDKNFDMPGLLIFGNTDNNITTSVINIRTEILRIIHESLRYTIEIATPIDKVEVCDENPLETEVLHRDQYEAIPVADYFMIIINNFQDFIFLAGKLIRSRSWNPYAKFIIFLINLNANEKQNIENTENILGCLFKYNAINVIVGVYQPGVMRNALLYSWKPYDPPRFCGYPNETAKNRLILENTCERGVIKDDNKVLFYNKLPDNMMNCALNILAIKRQPFVGDAENDPNIEKVLVNWMFGFYNFTVKYKIVNEFRGERNTLGVWNGALSKLSAKEGDILLGGIFPDFDVHEDFECSSSYLADSYAWVVPRADPSPSWVAMAIIFNTMVWCFIGAVFLLCVFLWKVLGDMSDDSMYHKSLIHSFLNTCIVTLGFSAYIRPVKQSLRIFFVFLNLYCTLLLTAYQSKLIQVLQIPVFENQLNTIEELVDSGLKFGGTEELHDLYSNSSDEFDIIIKEKWIDVDNVSSALIDVAVHRNFSVLCSRLELAHLSVTMPELIDNFGKLRYFTFKLNAFSVPAEMIGLRGYPFMRKFSYTLGEFIKLGINEGVRRRFARFNLQKRTSLLLAMNVQRSDFNPLSVTHLQGGFYALCLGMVSGSLVLVIEIIVSVKLFEKIFNKLQDLIIF